MRNLVRPPAGVVRPLPRPLSRSEAAREGCTRGGSTPSPPAPLPQRSCKRGVHPWGQYALSPGPPPAAKLQERGAPARVAIGSSREHEITEVHRRRWLTRRRGTHGHETRRPPLLQLRCGRGDGGEGVRPPPVSARDHASLGRGRGGHAKTLRSRRRDGIRTGARIFGKKPRQCGARGCCVEGTRPADAGLSEGSPGVHPGASAEFGARTTRGSC
jgi:hypothetical protein